MTANLFDTIWKNALLCVTYALVGYSVITLAKSGGYISPIWPSSGIALAAVLLFGSRLWIGAALGSFVLNYFTIEFHLPVLTAATMGLGVGLQALFGKAILTKCKTFEPGFIDEQSVVTFIVFGGVLSTLVSATVASMALYISDLMPLSELLSNWLVWWLGDTFGILLVTPVIISLISSQKDSWKGRVFIVNMSFLIMIALTAFVFSLSRTQEVQRLNNMLNQQFIALTNAFESQVDSHLAALQALANLSHVENPIADPKYDIFVRALLRQNSGFKAVSWNSLVHLTQLSKYEQSLSAKFNRPFKVLERDESGYLVPVSARDKYVVIEAVEPLAPYAHILGFDAYSEPVRKAAFDQAIRSGSLSATTVASLIQSEAKQPSILIFIPHSDHNRIQGFVTGVVDLHQLIDRTFHGIDLSGLQLKIDSLGATPGEVTELFKHNFNYVSELKTDFQHATTDFSPEQWRRSTIINLGNKQFQLVMLPSQDWLDSRKAPTPWFLLIFCIVLTVIIGAHVLVITGKHHMLSQLAFERERANQALSQSNDDLNTALLQLKEAQKQLVEQEKYASLGHLVSGLAHEINTPVGISVTASSTLRETSHQLIQSLDAGNLTKQELSDLLHQMHESSSLVVRNNTRAAALVERFKQLTMEKDEQQRCTFDLKQHLEKLILSFSEVIALDQHEILCHCPGLALSSYPNIFTFIFKYLIDNSLEHGFDKQKRGQIKIDLDYNDDALVIHYRDNGVGMDEETAKQIFSPFYTTKRSSGATGLGGTIFFNVATQVMKGKVECESQLGKGVFVSLVLPWDEDTLVKLEDSALGD